MPITSPITFSAGVGPQKAKGDALGAAVSAVVGAITGQEGWNGTVNGHRGFQPGNKYGALRHRNQTVVAAQKAHTQAKNAATKAIRAHGRKRSDATLREVRRAAKVAAAAHRELQAARQAAGQAKVDARRAKAMQARIERTMEANRDRLAMRAGQAIRDLKAKVHGGDYDGIDAHLAVDRIARGTNKGELFLAAKLAGIEHNAATKAQLVAHVRAHVAKPVRPTNLGDPSSHADHKPGHVGNLDTDLIHFDPGRFQYKSGVENTTTGIVGSLAGVRKFDHDLGGVLAVWKDPADGKVYVVNGHNRLDLAKHLGAGHVAVRFLDAKDARDARARGALINIAEGRGTAVDAAKFFRDSKLTREEIAEKGIPLREKIATDGIALSRLEDGVFRRVVDGTLSTEKGRIIGGGDLAHHEQRALLKLVDAAGKRKATEITNNHLRELADEVKSARSVRKETRDLFGSSVDDESLALHKTKLQATIKERLGKEKRLFGVVAKSKHAEELARAGNQIDTAASGKISQDAAATLGLFDTLKSRSGPVSKILNDAAERIHNGENPKQVTDETHRRIVKELPAILEAGDFFAR